MLWFMVWRVTLNHRRKILGVAFSFSGCCLLRSLGKNCSVALWLHLWQKTESGWEYISHDSYQSCGRYSASIGLEDNTERTDPWMILQALLPLPFLSVISVSNKTKNRDFFQTHIFWKHPSNNGKNTLFHFLVYETQHFLAILHL